MVSGLDSASGTTSTGRPWWLISRSSSFLFHDNESLLMMMTIIIPTFFFGSTERFHLQPLVYQ